FLPHVLPHESKLGLIHPTWQIDRPLKWPFVGSSQAQLLSGVRGRRRTQAPFPPGQGRVPPDAGRWRGTPPSQSATARQGISATAVAPQSTPPRLAPSA